MSKRKRREEEELEAQRARDAARAHLDKKGYVFDHAKTGIDIANAKKRKDNTLELVEKRKKQQELRKEIISFFLLMHPKRWKWQR